MKFLQVLFSFLLSCKLENQWQHTLQAEDTQRTHTAVPGSVLL